MGPGRGLPVVAGRILAVCLLAASWRSPLLAQTARPAAKPEAPTAGVLHVPDAAAGLAAGRALAGRPRATAIHTATPPSIDGAIDDLAWQRAARITSFVQERPVEGAPPTEETEVRIAYDSQHIYIAIHAFYSNPDIIRASRADRDRIGADDTVTVFFDPFLDQQRAYAFTVNAYGVQADSLLGGGGGGGWGGPGGRGGGPGGGGPGDSSWDALFHSAGTRVADGWTAELAIPFKSLRYPGRAPDQPHVWGFQIQRDINGKNESVVWAPVSRDVMGFLRQMGVLDGMLNLSTSRNIELLPSVTGIQTRSLDDDDARAYTTDAVREGGIGVKYGVTSNLTLDFTLNPDFSQIESDVQQIEVNQRFPLFFPELRPFFLEGQEIFSLPGPGNLVHTRTIVDPRYGAKLTGKVGQMTVGLVFANDQAPGRGEPTDHGYGQNAQVLVGRLRFDFASDSNVGLLVTDREFADTFSRTGAIDGRFRIGSNQRVSLKAVTSRHRDDEGVGRQGALYSVDYRKEGRRLSYGADFFSISPDFRTDTGFIRRVDERRVGADVSYRWWPESWVTNWGPNAQYSRNYTHDGVLQDERYNLGMNVQLARNVNFNGDVSRELERFQGIDFWKTRFGFGGRINTSRRVSFGGFINGGDEIRFVDDPFLGSSRGVNFSATLRPLDRLQSDISLSSSRFVDRRNDLVVFDVKIWRSQTSYQFTNRLRMRSIIEYDDFDETLGGNFLVTYRINAGTVFFVGYDDRYQRGDLIDADALPTSRLHRTNRAVFTKLQVLFRY